MIKKFVLILCLGVVALPVLIVSGCKIRITVPEGGSVVSESGAFECQSGDVCMIDVYDLYFDEVFVALPEEGFRFIKWKRVHRSLCPEKTTPCRIFSAWAQRHEKFMEILESDQVFNLEPEFDVYGTRMQTELVKDIRPGPESGSPWNLIDSNRKLYFTAEDGGSRIWQSDGTSDGTLILKDFAPDKWGGDPGAFATAHWKLFFRGTDYLHGTELWASDGTTEGTVLTKDIWPGDGRGLLSWPMPWRDSVLIIADDGKSGPQFWTSDGTEAGTVRFNDVAVSIKAKARNFWEFGNGWLFKSTDSLHGAELWRTDGIEGNSKLVKDIVPGPAGSFSFSPFSFAKLNDSSGVFWVWDEDGTELWITDGTESGTQRLWRLPDADAEAHYWLIPHNNLVTFFLMYPSKELAMWRTDGTVEGTILVKGGFYDEPGEFLEYDGFLYITLMTTDFVSGRELWRTDGTPEGTELFLDLYPGEIGSSPQQLTLYADRMYFSADDGKLGEELYRTDGTVVGTELVADIATGPASSNPGQLTVSQFSLFFDANTPETGTELYKTIVLP